MIRYTSDAACARLNGPMHRSFLLSCACLFAAAGCDPFPDTPPVAYDQDAGDSGQDGSAAGAGGSDASVGTGGTAGFAGTGGANHDAGTGGHAGFAGGTGDAGHVVTMRVSDDDDDVNEDGADFHASSSTVWVGTGEDVHHSYAGFRFQDVQIPAGVNVVEARFELYDEEGQWTKLDMVIGAEANSNCKAFRASQPPSKRSLTEARVHHVSDEAWTPAAYNFVDDLREPVQEVLSAPAWNEGNALCVIVRGSGASFGRKYVAAHEGAATKAARLFIAYAP